MARSAFAATKSHPPPGCRSEFSSAFEDAEGFGWGVTNQGVDLKHLLLSKARSSGTFEGILGIIGGECECMGLLAGDRGAGAGVHACVQPGGRRRAA